MASEATAGRKFVPAVLPWLVAAGALLVYLLTLNHWVSFSSLSQVARVSGWLDWQPEVSAPVFWLVTYPFHWLPARGIPLALNLFAAACAAVTLAWLARSVALLPHDRTEPERLRERSASALLSLPTAWLPPVIAAVICGLQLTFWENATAASSEIFDLLLFAYVVRCLLEFRLDRRDSWLLRAGLVYAASMANNWAMVGFLPLFLVALVWLKGLSFFDAGFLGRMSLLALVGLLCYLLLPLVSVASGSPLGFWQALKANLGNQKFFLSNLVFSKIMLFKSDPPLWVLALPSLVPILMISIRWPEHFGGDVSKIGIALNTYILHCVYGALLLLCSWVALDPEHFGPRHLLPQIPLLTFYYLGALSIGYFVGYFLLVFGAHPTRRGRQMPGYPLVLSGPVLGGVGVVLLLVPVLQLYRNLPQIRTTNGPALRHFADLLAAKLPAQGATALSDDGGKLCLLQSDLVQSGRARPFVFIDTGWLQFPAYHRYLAKHYPGLWTSNPPKDRTDRFEGLELLPLITKLNQTKPLYYLHPSFGYYFEAFYLEPDGLIYKLHPYAPKTLFVPRLTSEQIASNEAFWDGIEPSVLQPLAAVVQMPAGAHSSGLLGHLAGRLQLVKERNPSVIQLAAFYSRALDYWGVELQRSSTNLLTRAQARFQLAKVLNPDNIAAQANLDCNHDLLAGQQPSLQVSRAVQDQFAKYHDWNEAMNINGPFDQPSLCYAQAMAFAYPTTPRSVPQYHQAAQLFRRVSELVPNDQDCRLHEAEVCVYGQAPDEALQAAADIRAREAALNFSRTNQPWLLAIETAAYLAKGDTTGAVSVVQQRVSEFPNHQDLLTAAGRMFITFRCFSNALDIINQELQTEPDDPNALYFKGLCSVQLKSYDPAIRVLSRVLTIETNHTSQLHAAALLYRAEAYLESNRLDEAQRDYESLQKDIPTAFSLYKQLAEIAYRKKDTTDAVRNYQLYLNSLPTNQVEEITSVKARLNELRHGST